MDPNDKDIVITSRANFEAVTEENARLREERNTLEHRLTGLHESAAALAQERNELQGWKESQLQVERQWNPQRIGQLLNLPIGCSVRSELEPAILGLLSKCAQMREALTKIKSSGHTMFPRTVDYALSTDCGNGWKSPEEYAALEAKCAEMRLMLMQLYSEEFEMGYIIDQHGYKECGHCGGLDDHRPGCIQLAIEKALSTDLDR